MWRPGFDFSEKAPAALIGAHRSLCIYSFHHRGTEEHPGLVLGLDEGGACRGVAFRVAPARETRRSLICASGSKSPTSMWGHQAGQPARRLWPRARSVVLSGRPRPSPICRPALIEAQAHLVRSAVGRSGSNIDYVLNTVRHLEEAGIHDVELMALAAHLAANPVSPRALPQLPAWSARARRRNSPAYRRRPLSPASWRSSRRPPIRRRW